MFLIIIIFVFINEEEILGIIFKFTSCERHLATQLILNYLVFILNFYNR
jgi:hypothetical protein